MLRRLIRGEPPMVIITDTGMLMSDVWASCRGPKVTSLLWALHNDGAILVLPKHVVTETMEHLPRRAGTTGDVTLAYQRLKTLYLPWAVVVDDVPKEWGAGDPRVEALAVRDPTDLPAARLAVALAPCYLLAEDPDICTPGLAAPNWLPVTHAASNDAEVTMMTLAGVVPTAIAFEGLNGAARAVSSASKRVQGLLLLTLLAGTWWLTKTRRGRHISERLASPAGTVLNAVGPPLLQIAQRQADGLGHLKKTVVVAPANRVLSEVAASVLATDATHNQPLLSVDVARQIDGFGNLRERTAAVRSILQAHPETFTEVSHGRFALGHGLPLPRVALDSQQVGDFLRRSHQDALLNMMALVRPSMAVTATPLASEPTPGFNPELCVRDTKEPTAHELIDVEAHLLQVLATRSGDTSATPRRLRVQP